MLYDLQEDSAIDPHKLDDECLFQAGLYAKWVKLEVIAKTEVDDTKRKLQKMKASESIAVRRNPTKYGFEKVTDKVVDALVTVSKKVQKLERALLKKAEVYNTCTRAVSVMDTKKRMLEKLVDRHTSGFFAAPKTKQGYKDHKTNKKDK